MIDISNLNDIKKTNEMSFTGTASHYRFSFLVEEEEDALWITSPNILYRYNLTSGSIASIKVTQAPQPNGIGRIGEDIFIFDQELGIVKIPVR